MKKQQILIIEDEPFTATDIRKILETRGYEVPGIASTGMEALEMTDKYNPDIILMDIVIGGEIDGISTVEKIQAKYNIPVIYITAHSDKSTLTRVKSTWPYGYILKPINPNELILIIELTFYKIESELKLKESERQISTILQTAIDGFWLVDANGIIMDVNDAYCRMIGYERDEIINSHISKFISSKNREEISKHINKIFDPFEQLKDGKVSRSGGTGLGLAISKKLVELHGGSLTVTSHEGSGSRFLIKLPERINIENVPGLKKIVSSTVGSNKIKKNSSEILVVEDNEMNLELIKESLEPLGYSIDYTKNGEDALKMSKEKKYDIILMDIQLPGMDGVKTMKNIRQIYTKHVPVIALTAYAMKGDREQYLAEGFDDYLSKPLNLDLLIKTIYNILTIKEH